MPAKEKTAPRKTATARPDVPQFFRMNVEVGDLPAAAAFYAQLLGLPARVQAGSRAFFTCGAVTLVVLDVTAAAPPHPRPSACTSPCTISRPCSRAPTRSLRCRAPRCTARPVAPSRCGRGVSGHSTRKIRGAIRCALSRRGRCTWAKRPRARAVRTIARPGHWRACRSRDRPGRRRGTAAAGEPRRVPSRIRRRRTPTPRRTTRAKLEQPAVELVREFGVTDPERDARAALTRSVAEQRLLLGPQRRDVHAAKAALTVGGEHRVGVRLAAFVIALVALEVDAVLGKRKVLGRPRALAPAAKRGAA